MPMAAPGFEVREAFHLLLLQHLSARLTGRGYFVDGGMCPRFYHRSARLSENMDLDVASDMRKETRQRSAFDQMKEQVETKLGELALR